MPPFPSLFLSHGSPMLALEDCPAHRFLTDYGRRLGRPEAIVVATAHWESDRPAVGADPSPDTVYDFYGFPTALSEIRYEAPGDPALAGRVASKLADAELPATVDTARGLDHGIWVPLCLLYPAADIPVVPVAVQPDAGPAHHLALGAALRPLRKEGVLVIGSGSATHNLAEFRGQALDADVPEWVSGFGDWVADTLVAGRRDDLVHYRERAPHAVRNHPTEEHFMPLFVAMGAGEDGGSAERVHASHNYGVLAMDAYAFA